MRNVLIVFLQHVLITVLIIRRRIVLIVVGRGQVVIVFLLLKFIVLIRQQRKRRQKKKLLKQKARERPINKVFFAIVLDVVFLVEERTHVKCFDIFMVNERRICRTRFYSGRRISLPLRSYLKLKNELEKYKMSLDYEYNLNFLFLEKFDSLLNIKRTLLILIMKKNIELIEYKKMEIFFSFLFKFNNI